MQNDKMYVFVILSSLISKNANNNLGNCFSVNNTTICKNASKYMR